MTLDVLLATCASSRELTTSVQFQLSPTVSIFETFCPWVGLVSDKCKTDLCTRAPFLFVAHAAIRIPPSLVSRNTPRFELRRLLVLVLISGAHVSTTIHWKGDSVPLRLSTPLTVFGIWSFFFAVYVRSLEIGFFVEVVARGYCYSRLYCSYFSESSGLRASRSTLRSLLKVSSVPRLQAL